MYWTDIELSRSPTQTFIPYPETRPKPNGGWLVLPSGYSLRGNAKRLESSTLWASLAPDCQEGGLLLAGSKDAGIILRIVMIPL